MTTDSQFLDDAYDDYLDDYANSVFGEETTAEVDINLTEQVAQVMLEYFEKQKE